MPQQKSELQIKILKVLDVREGKCGKSFKIKVAHHKPTWVPEIKLSPGVSEAYLNKLSIPKGVWVHMARHYKDKPKPKNPLLFRSPLKGGRFMQTFKIPQIQLQIFSTVTRLILKTSLVPNLFMFLL